MQYLVIGINYENGCSFSSLLYCDPSKDNIKELLAKEKHMNVNDIDELLIIDNNLSIRHKSYSGTY
jgi:hypothetical protein